MKFEIGDRVRVYASASGGIGIFKGIVQEIDPIPNGKIRVSTPGRQLFWFYPQQCRKLVKKQRREFWIRLCDDEINHDMKGAVRADTNNAPPEKVCDDCQVIRVREVKEEK